MKKIIVASQNPVKIKAVRNGFNRMFPGLVFSITPVDVPSGVLDQPFTNEETLRGALNRSTNARKAVPKADYWVGIEGGVEQVDGGMSAFAWVVVRSPTVISKGRTGTFFLPPAVVELIKSGKELGEADDIVFNRRNSKQESGAIGILTGEVIDRTALYEHGVLMSLVAFKNPDLYPSGIETDRGE